MALESSRTEIISGSKVAIYDNQLSEAEVKKSFGVFGQAGFSFLHASRQDTAASREWAASFSVEDFKSHRLHTVFQDLAVSFSGGKKLNCYDVFCNASTYGDMSFIHNDSTNPTDLSLLYYANPEWNPEWGGETVFFDEDDDARVAIGIKPGRIVVFGGHLKHRAGLPTRICPEVRLTLSVRFEVAEEA